MRTPRAAVLLRLVAALAVGSGALAGRSLGVQGYAPIPAFLTRADTLRPRAALVARNHDRAAIASGVLVSGLLSARGLPPVPGTLFVSDTGLVFRPADGSEVATYPVVGPVRPDGYRPSSVSLAWVEQDAEPPVYLFRIDAGVFQTEAPGLLLEVARHPAWLDSLGATEWTADRPLVDPSDTAGLGTAVRRAASPYADSLYVLFGRPHRAFGLVGSNGRTAGRLGEYVAFRDSLALDPGRMTSDAQLRHALAHELGHRWQAHASAQLATLWQGVPPIRDPRRYGHGNVSEHQAEAIAFAIHFLQTTASGAESPERGRALLDQYELLVPGTRLMARYFALQPLYHNHPLERMLTLGGSPAGE